MLVSRSIFVFAYLIALLSGACALVYQIAWMRVFIPVFGLSVHATTTVVIAFMAGLGLGSLSAPSLLRRWQRSLWLLYALIECGIGLGAILIPLSVGPITRTYVAVAHLVPENSVLIGSTRFLLAVLVMLVPTFLMGLTLPVLAQAFRTLSAEDPIRGKRIGLLYGFNTLGAALGCLVVGFILLYHFGVFTTICLTAALNFTLAAVVLALLLPKTARLKMTEKDSRKIALQQEESADSSEYNMTPTSLLFLYAIIGFCSFGFELSWFRILIFYLQATVYSFSVMLALFLSGLGLGSLCYARYIEPRLEKNGTLEVRAALARTQLFVGLIGICTLHLYRALPHWWRSLIQLVGGETWTGIMSQKILITSLIIIPSTFLMGLVFPLLARLLKSHGYSDAKTIAHLYAANTVGGVAGCLATGFILFDVVGVQTTLLIFSLLSFGVGIVFAAKPVIQNPSLRVRMALVGLVFVVFCLITDSRMLIANYERFLGKILFYRESAADITMVHEKNGVRILAFNDGRGTSSTHPTLNYINRLLAYSTMMMKPDAKDILVISMGCGNTASAYAAFPIERLDIVDISSGPFEAASFFPTNNNVLLDPRVRTFVEDGRNFLLKTKNNYDIIQLELPTLHTDGVVNLYTKEFYEIAKRRLRRGGVLSQWIDVDQTGQATSFILINSLRQVFPQVSVWTRLWSWWGNAVKQEAPLVIDLERAREVFSLPSVRKDLRSVGSSFEDILSNLKASPETAASVLADAMVITDDHTVVDFLVPRLESSAAIGGGVGYYTSPLAPIFIEQWSKNSSSVAKAPEVVEFFSREEEQTAIESSLEQLLPSLKKEQRLRIADMGIERGWN